LKNKGSNGGNVGPIAQQVGEELLSAALHEAADEIHGRSSRRWGVALLALLLGVALGVVVAQLRRRQLAAGRGEPPPPHLRDVRAGPAKGA
jgi:hypothetical protein